MSIYLSLQIQYQSGWATARGGKNMESDNFYYDQVLGSQLCGKLCNRMCCTMQQIMPQIMHLVLPPAMHLISDYAEKYVLQQVPCFLELKLLSGKGNF